MRSILLASGAAVLRDTPADIKLSVLGFAVGDRSATADEMRAWDVAEPTLGAMQGTVTYRADYTKISWSKTGASEARFVMLIDEAAPETRVANFVMLVGATADTAQPFSFSASERSAIKLSTNLRSPGTRYPYHFTLQLPGLFERFDFSNLSQRLPEWLRVSTERDLPDPLTEGHDQAVVARHTEWGGVHPALNVDGRYFGMPYGEPLTGGTLPERWVLSGGISGDNYKRTP